MPQPRGGAQPPMAIDIDKPRQAPLSARSYPAPCKLAEAPRAQMAELVDAPASGAGARKGVEVRVLFWAPFPCSSMIAGGCQTHGISQDREGCGAGPEVLGPKHLSREADIWIARDWERMDLQ